MLPKNLAGMSLVGQNLHGADLSNGAHQNADFTNADLSAANLSNSNLGGAILSGANLRGAMIDNTVIDKKYAGLIKYAIGIPIWSDSDQAQSIPRNQSGSLTKSRWKAAGKPIKCPHCGNEFFYARSFMLNTQTATFLNLDWLNANASVLECGDCSYLCWFAKPPTSV